MANPVPAFNNTSCDGCGNPMDEGDDLFLTNEGRLCTKCAEEEDYVCDCGSFKKKEYDACYECNHGT